MTPNSKESGFIRLIIGIIIGLVLIKIFFDFDVVDYVGSEEFKNFSRGVWAGVKAVWMFILDTYDRIADYIIGMFQR